MGSERDSSNSDRTSSESPMPSERDE
jgi:hypothetical protein